MLYYEREWFLLLWKDVIVWYICLLHVCLHMSEQEIKVTFVRLDKWSLFCKVTRFMILWKRKVPITNKKCNCMIYKMFSFLSTYRCQNRRLRWSWTKAWCSSATCKRKTCLSDTTSNILLAGCSSTRVDLMTQRRTWSQSSRYLCIPVSFPGVKCATLHHLQWMVKNAGIWEQWFVESVSQP